MVLHARYLIVSNGMNHYCCRIDYDNMSSFVEIKVRMTPEKRSIIQDHARAMGESTTVFINRAIQETMERDNDVLGPSEGQREGNVDGD